MTAKETDNVTVETLLKELETIKTNQAALIALEAQCKADIKRLLDDIGIDDYKSDNYGSIRIQKRAQKDYGEEIEMMTDQLKMTKKLAEDLGDYKIVSYKESIVYSPPKDVF